LTKRRGWRRSTIKDKKKWWKMRRRREKGVRKTNLILYTIY
jgi:hypothetical protein